jgi:anti-sigma-K factor RskA
MGSLPEQSTAGSVEPDTVIEFKKPEINWLPWALAACLALGCIFIAADNLKQREKIANVSPPSTVDSLYVAVLGSLIENAPDATAVAVWDADRQEGVLTASNLPGVSDEEDYQLWIIAPENPAPISAGVFQVAEDGTARFAFRPESGSAAGGVFAISREPRGGSPQPQGPVVLASSGS